MHSFFRQRFLFYVELDCQSLHRLKGIFGKRRFVAVGPVFLNFNYICFVIFLYI